MQFCLCQMPKPALVRYLVKSSINGWEILLSFNLTRKLSNVFKGFKVMPEYFKKQKFCEPQESREVSDIYFSIIYQSNSLAKKCGTGLIREGKICRRFAQDADKLSLAGLVAASSIHHRFGNAGAAMIR